MADSPVKINSPGGGPASPIAGPSAEEQKKKGLKLTAQTIAEEKGKLDFKSKLDGATKKLSEAEVNLEIARGELGQATKNIKSAHEANASLQAQSTSIAAELQ